MKRDGTINRDDLVLLEVVWLGGHADLSDKTDAAYGLVESARARRLARDGLLSIDHGRATLTEQGQGYVRKS